jgi:hypothetical protein
MMSVMTRSGCAAEQSHTAQTVDGSSHLVAGVLQE